MSKSSLPLPTLLWRVLHDLEVAYAQLGAGQGALPALDLWANLLRVVSVSGSPRSALPQALRLSRRAVRTRISTAMRQGWIEERKPRPGQAEIRLTERGAAAADRFRHLERAAEEAWSGRVGADHRNRLRAALEAIVAALPLEHPHYPARYGAADARVTGGNGVEWKAVPRVSGGRVSQLPSSALVSQALVAFAMDYERRSPVALSVSLSVLRRVGVEGTSLRTLGHSVDVSALLRHGFLRLGADGDTVWLTSLGIAVRSSHEEWIAAVESAWTQQFGAAAVQTLRSTLASVVRQSRVTTVSAES